ncbi:hypothetical protein GWK47_015271 [Chionoecetes opilio]|uniref:Cleavage inducing molecular chaperone Jiv domain-containing protein n=1 Tax=Chionoecetes opilio TaxID=41210 RepID=A0A8J5BZW5_CHIOP|nr:hypothetical protein GWK47_015271 [Chionoecetes opilio]
MDWVLDKVVDQSDCGASVGNTKITDLVFADDAVIFAESLEVLVMALEALHEEAKPLELEVSWLKTKVQVFGDLLDEAVQSVHACGKDIEILESFTYLGSAVHNDGGSRQEVLQQIGIAHGVMDSFSGSIWRCRYLCRRTKIRIFKLLVIPVLLYGCETWTLNSDLKRRINAFGSWYQRPELHRWTWYSNAGGVAKEIDHILVSTRWRILQNCRVYRSAEFFGTDHRLVVATLKLHVKSRRISRGNHTVFHLEKLKDLTCAHEYAVAVSNRFDVLGALGDPVELWDTFKRETLQAAKECIGERPRSRRDFVSTETLEKIEESRAARLAGNRDQHRALSRRTRTLLRRDKGRYVRSLAEDVEGHLNANDLRPAYRALKKLRSKSSSRASAIRTADGRLVSDMDGQMARWAEYFGQLFTVDPPTEQLHTTGLQAVDADPPIDETAPSLDEVREAVVAKLKGGKAAGVCNISAELLKAGGAVYDISEWAACQSDNLKHLQANTHSVQYRIVSGKKNPPSKNNTPEFPSDPDLEEFFNNLCKEKFGKNYASGSNQGGGQQMPDTRKRKGKKKK